MYIHRSHEGDRYYYYLVEKVKVEGNRYKVEILEDLGDLPDNLPPHLAEEINKFISNEAQAVQKACKKKYSKREITIDEVIDYLNTH